MKKPTPFKDAHGKDIYLRDLVMVGRKVGWIWGVACAPQVGWDVVGPSCEDSIPLEEVFKDQYARVVVIGMIREDI